MLWFLDLAKRAGLLVASYSDTAKGRMTADKDPWIDRVDLFPVITWDGETPDSQAVEHLHHRAHDRCFIANSIKSEVVVNHS